MTNRSSNGSAEAIGAQWLSCRGAAILLLAVAGATFWALQRGMLPHWMDESSFAGFLVGLCGTVLILLFLRLVAATPKEAKTERILRKQIDDHNHRAQYLYLLLAALVAFDGWTLSTGTAAPGADLRAWVTPAAFDFIVLCLGALVCFGPGCLRSVWRRALNDEWTRAMRERAALFGYMLAVAALSAAYLVSLYRPEWNIWLLPPVMAAVVVIPTFVFLTQQWRAERSNG